MKKNTSCYVYLQSPSKYDDILSYLPTSETFNEGDLPLSCHSWGGDLPHWRFQRLAGMIICHHILMVIANKHNMKYFSSLLNPTFLLLSKSQVCTAWLKDQNLGQNEIHLGNNCIVFVVLPPQIVSFTVANLSLPGDV